MANPAAARPDGILIADQYVVETGRKLVPVGGLASFAVTDRVSGRRDLMAIQLDRRLPPRPRAFQVLATPIEGLLTPIVCGHVRDACYAICLAPPGPSVQTRERPWSEAELLACVLRPAARVLEVTGSSRDHPSRDPARQRVPERARTTGRVGGRLDRAAGDGTAGTVRAAVFRDVPALRPRRRSIADDVYALGVLLLCLALGRRAAGTV